jgi:hypothetical protein
MPNLMIHDPPGGAQEQYEEAGRRIAGNDEGLTSLGDSPVDGILFHTAGPTEDGWRVVDAWEPEEAFASFDDWANPARRGLSGRAQGLSASQLS